MILHNTRLAKAFHNVDGTQCGVVCSEMWSYKRSQCMLNVYLTFRFISFYILIAFGVGRLEGVNLMSICLFIEL